MLAIHIHTGRSSSNSTSVCVGRYVCVTHCFIYFIYLESNKSRSTAPYCTEVCVKDSKLDVQSIVLTRINVLTLANISSHRLLIWLNVYVCQHQSEKEAVGWISLITAIDTSTCYHKVSPPCTFLGKDLRKLHQTLT